MITFNNSRFQRKLTHVTLKLYCCWLKERIPKIKSEIPVDIDICNQPLELKNIQRSVIEKRISMGHKFFIAQHRSEPVAYIFVSTKECWVGEVDDMLEIGKGEVYLYDAFTYREYRGNHIYPCLMSHIARFYRKKNYSLAIIFTTLSNRISSAGIERVGLTCYEKVDFFNIFGLKVWNYKKGRKDVRSKFRNEYRETQ